MTACLRASVIAPAPVRRHGGGIPRRQAIKPLVSVVGELQKPLGSLHTTLGHFRTLWISSIGAVVLLLQAMKGRGAAAELAGLAAAVAVFLTPGEFLARAELNRRMLGTGTGDVTGGAACRSPLHLYTALHNCSPHSPHSLPSDRYGDG